MTDRQSDKQTERIHRQTGQIDKQRETETKRDKKRVTNRKTDRESVRHKQTQGSAYTRDRLKNYIKQPQSHLLPMGASHNPIRSNPLSNIQR